MHEYNCVANDIARCLDEVKSSCTSVRNNQVCRTCYGWADECGQGEPVVTWEEVTSLNCE